MTQLDQINIGNHSDSDNIYLSKILIFTSDAHSVADHLSAYSESSINLNCLNTIGMYPFISRIETSLGILCLSNWIINPSQQFSQFRLPYYSGASHVIVLCNDQLEQENVNDLLALIPNGVPITLVTIGEKIIENDSLPQFIQEYLSEESTTKIRFQEIDTINNLSEVFHNIGQLIADSILSGEYETYIPDRTKTSKIRKLYLKRSFSKIQELVGNLGYTLEESGKVTVLQKKFTYEVDFYRNSVTANITKCQNCTESCKHYRKLCVVEDKQGYSNFGQFDNLRALAILYSIYNNSFTTLQGEKPHENVKYQLNRLDSLYQTNCKIVREEKQFEKLQNRQKKKKKSK